MDSEISFLCWRCKKYKGTFFHMLWSCEQLSLFWKFVTKMISQCLNASVPLSPRLCLLGTNMSDKWNIYESMYIDLALMAARKCIALNGRRPNPQQWSTGGMNSQATLSWTEFIIIVKTEPQTF